MGAINQSAEEEKGVRRRHGVWAQGGRRRWESARAHRQDVVEQRRLAGAQEAREHGDRHLPVVGHIVEFAVYYLRRTRRGHFASGGVLKGSGTITRADIFINRTETERKPSTIRCLLWGYSACVAWGTTGVGVCVGAGG